MPSATEPSSATASDVGAVRPGATGLMVSAMLLVAEAVVPSVLVAVMVRLAVVTSPALRLSPESCAGVRVQVPLLFLVPAESVASEGTPEIVIDTVSRESNGVSVMPSATVPSSETASDVGAVSVGATGFTVSAMLLVVEAVAPWVLVAMMVRLAVVTSPALRLRPDNCAGVEVQVPLLFLVPADSVASLGTPEIVIDTVSRESNGVSVMPSATEPSSATTSDVGAVSVGATGFTVRATFCVTTSPSELVAVTVRVAFVTSPACSVRPASCAVVSVRVPLVTVSGPALSENVTPDGMPEIVTVTAPLVPMLPLVKMKSLALS